jgi:hypothetical protein
MDTGYAYLDNLLDGLLVSDMRTTQAELMEEQGAAVSAAACEAYELRLVEEARALVAGKQGVPTVEHLRVLLERLGGATPTPEEGDEAPF